MELNKAQQFYVDVCSTTVNRGLFFKFSYNREGTLYLEYVNNGGEYLNAMYLLPVDGEQNCETVIGHFFNKFEELLTDKPIANLNTCENMFTSVEKCLYSNNYSSNDELHSCFTKTIFDRFDKFKQLSPLFAISMLHHVRGIREYADDVTDKLIALHKENQNNSVLNYNIIYIINDMCNADLITTERMQKFLPIMHSLGAGKPVNSYNLINTFSKAVNKLGDAQEQVDYKTALVNKTIGLIKAFPSELCSEFDTGYMTSEKNNLVNLSRLFLVAAQHATDIKNPKLLNELRDSAYNTAVKQMRNDGSEYIDNGCAYFPRNITKDNGNTVQENTVVFFDDDLGGYIISPRFNGTFTEYVVAINDNTNKYFIKNYKKYYSNIIKRFEI